MVKVLHFDHDEGQKEKYFPKLGEAIRSNPDIELDEMDTPVHINFGIGVEELEARLPMYDVLICHPGIKGQKYIFEDVPNKFPNLRTVILTDCPSDYNVSRGNVAILSFNDVDSILNYILHQESGGNRI